LPVRKPSLCRAQGFAEIVTIANKVREARAELTGEELLRAGARGRASGAKIDDDAIRAAANKPFAPDLPNYTADGLREAAAERRKTRS
jgi:hypothetical protein